jgi:prolyl-tRNA synthetase
MRLSHYFIPILKENPSEASIPSHQLMLRAGMIRQITSGIYTWLPLGLKVLRNIENIIRTEINKSGALEILMPSIQPAELWQLSGRYDDYGKEMLRMKDRHERDMLFGPTHEEVVTDIFKNNIKTYKDLPKNLYQIQWKFRDEIRPRFGVMRGREFLMKDGYSFDLDFEGAKASYNLMYKTYFKVFKALGLKAIALHADSGAIGGDLSHEFHIVADKGESEIFYDKAFDEIIQSEDMDIEQLQNIYAATVEKHDQEKCNVPAEHLAVKRGIEVGHIFYFGTKYSKSMGAYVTNNEGAQVPVEMGSYGIGVSRLVGGIIETSHDDKGIIWPTKVAPFMASLININPKDEKSTQIADDLYYKLVGQNIEVLYDDTTNSAGSKFATHDLLGMPWQMIIGPKLAANNMLELKHRATGEKHELSVESVIARLSESQG